MLGRLFKPIILGLLVGIVGLTVSIFPFALSLDENMGLDVLFKLRGERQAPADVVIVSIDKESSENLNLPDKTLAIHKYYGESSHNTWCSNWHCGWNHFGIWKLVYNYRCIVVTFAPPFRLC